MNVMPNTIVQLQYINKFIYRSQKLFWEKWEIIASVFGIELFHHNYVYKYIKTTQFAAISTKSHSCFNVKYIT